MSITRVGHTASLLLDGKVLVAGGDSGSVGFLGTAEVFDPANGSWSPTGSMTNIFGFPTNAPSNMRAYHTATLLANGKVLVAGGFNGNILASAQLYDPVTGVWTETGFMNTARYNHTATLLPSGKVLVVGGLDITRSSLVSTELYDPVTGTWTESGALTESRWAHTATLLPNGKVLVAAGREDITIISFATVLFSSELFDPGTGLWTTSSSLNTGRYDHTATLLPNGKVLVAGGLDGFNPISGSELYDPTTATWTTSGALKFARDTPAATLLPDGKVIATGGFGAGNAYLSSGEIYNPTLGSWATNGVGAMRDQRWQHTATLMSDGKVLLAGGYNGVVVLDTTEVYDSGVTPATNGFLKVTLSPAAAVSLGALWQVDGGAFHTNGAVVTNLSGGTHVVSFTNIPGWIKPADQLTTIVSRTGTNLVSGVYTLNPGAIQMTLNPAGAVTAGAQWKVDGGAFQNSGAVVSNLSVGEHTVAFKTIGGWYAPGNKIVTVVTDTTTNLTGTYSLSAGGLQVNLIPAGAVTDGARWQVDGGAFQTNGAVVDSLSVGDHLLAFKPVAGWTTPSNQIVGITAGAITVAGGNYGSLATGALRVNLSPASAVSAGARWSVDGGALQISGAVVTGLAPGDHVIDFKTVPGFFTLTSQTNAVSSNITNTYTGTYIASETTKPTLTVIAPGSGKRYSNEVFTAIGTAKDNVRVANVFYQFNTNDWVIANTSNNFTNWNVPNLVLNPGSNTFKVYAVDTSNNRSTTNTVKFTYVLSDRLLLQTTGKGTLSPNYSNAFLEIGRNYSMTATASKGYRFTNWTGSLTTNKAKLTFNMQSNLSFTANFVDVTRPVNILLAPKANQRSSNLLFTATGKASDNLRVSNVWYQLNTNAWTNAITGNNWTNWSAPDLLLTPGTNIIRTYAEDTTGNRSLTNTIKFVYVLTDRVLVRFVNGRGTLSPNYSNAVLEIGKNYSMTATPAKGFQFVNWTGSLTTNKAKLTFNMQSNLSFTANFLDITRPVNVITVPVANQKTSNAVFVASGKATDNVGVSNVWYQLNGTGWNLATLALNGTNWATPNLTLLSGSNQLQAFAMDAAGNRSLTNKVSFSYKVLPVADWAPDSLNGLLAQLTPDGETRIESMGFDVTTFAQTGTRDDSEDFGVGSYTYNKTGTNTALLTLVLTAPMNVTNNGGDLTLVFTNHYSGYFTNDSIGGDWGSLNAFIATNFIPGSLSGKTMTVIDSGGGSRTNVIKFVNGTAFAKTPASAGSGGYTFTRFSPVQGMVTLTYTNVAKLGQVDYLQTTFTNVTAGTSFSTIYTNLAASPAIPATEGGSFKLK